MPMSGNKPWQIDYLDSVIKEDISVLPRNIKNSIRRAIEERLTIDPVGFGKPLRYSLQGHRRLRVSDYRVVYRIEVDSHTVLIVAIKHRKDVYEQ